LIDEPEIMDSPEDVDLNEREESLSVSPFSTARDQDQPQHTTENNFDAF